MDKYGLIGYPIAHSLSPVLFNQAYGGKWAYELIEEPSFEDAWQRFMSDYRAVNVTAPYKEPALAAADVIPDYVRSIGAANILVKTPEGVLAHNSDFLGVKAILSDLFGQAPGDACNHVERPQDANALLRAHRGERDEACAASDVGSSGAAGDSRGQSPLKPKPTILVVGFGGAGKAAAAAARALGMDVVVCNRSTDKAPGIRPLEEIPLLAAVSDIVIYTLPCPIPETDGMQCPVLLEANYRTPALEGHPGIGRYIHGREWIVRQAELGYALMTGREPGPISLNN